jgi:hypothetical protein
LLDNIAQRAGITGSGHEIRIVMHRQKMIFACEPSSGGWRASVLPLRIQQVYQYRTPPVPRDRDLLQPWPSYGSHVIPGK